ncbi:hypothetical protein [Chitinimonas sp. BJB300]|uniref:hypothetical protein n=1 Tax=Chitinimonas sp. BJB300 TaxID=1559339 RepID=UPI000C0ECE05|nr:hypothetical protein [Chitinimonas sp. BJB300]PHV10243.1 hypothetical protein CSQ89_17245 [Chitinimonas sp. BJB300]TSJ91108.1 hypothetical protein FG002_002055 [Chitinimonas sp. BJB300]
METVQQALPKAVLIFTIEKPSDFISIMDTSICHTSACTKARLTLDSTTPGVSYDPVTDIVAVTQKVWLEFSVAPDTTNKKPLLYHVVGMAFKGDGGDVVGLKAFPVQHITNHKLEIDAKDYKLRIVTVKDADPAHDDFDFLLLIQRSSDGALGVIDPKIVNVTFGVIQPKIVNVT